MQSGWIKSYRTILDHDLLANDNSAFIVFMKLLHKVDKQTGQYITGRFKLGELTNLKPTTAWDTLQRLKNHKMVTLTSDNKKTTIRICNWQKWQGNGDSSGDNKVTTNRQQSDNKVTLNNNKEVRIKNNSLVKELAKPDNRNLLINEMFSYWETQVGYEIASRMQANRRACFNLLRKHGEENLRKLIGGVALASGDKYAPSISDFADLQAKYNALILWGKKQSTAIKRKVVI